ncbi:MAG: 2-oxoglutarate dehydrogenase complex dihydrolipoyllysine-residue succinyltransferase [Alphaproteobacteria bacterium]|uniref:2-oxoglutarate dehydrogenase complex dihydrolipoyllysine-residue succinyltransferase n=1 Tax=Hyphomonas sp. TaxID=87 RepID=UPI001D58A300|nr:2-oxoglutarate dehydrogenase complex dihydrolipoyllysine-residue succinyltransferase [Alphaproteobacteria bacterium]MBU2142809.1 2-oxoglutarate dehydrogenase complex dihydrolipoyllysine-residue succinyltransferase [Alphaproteobacteria bacterium]MBU2195231.1 2-oxoglutarate dehydrogenase complex dihydrolipoyllysine-residue succinyltransferase [Alphaproteobacteria bacterium]
MTDISVPTLGESVTEATVGQWLKAAGDTVKRDDVLVELETDKVSVEVSAPEDGVLSEIVAKEGETVEIGALLGRVNAGDGANKSAPAKAESSAPAKESKPAAKEEAKPAASDGKMTDVVVPAMGESVAEGTLSTFLKKVGDSVKKDETIAEIETDKVALEVPSPADGVIAELVASEGDGVTPGSVIARISAGGAASAPSASPASPPPAAKAAAEGAPVSPSVRRISSEAGVDPSNIPGSGRDGRATKADALDYVNNAASKASSSKAVTESRAPRDVGPREERVRMTRLRQTIARRLKEAQDSAAMLTTFNDVDMGAIMDLRKKHQDSFVAKHGIKLGFMSFFVKACVNALKEVPAVNAEIDGTDIIYKNYYDIGVAVGTDKGLVVPVVRDSDDLSLAGIEKYIADLGKRARDGDLTIGDMQGGTFTISNGGIYGSLMSTPILNPPQSGVLGMHRIENRPVAINGEVKIRPMMYLALSYDHRIVDGKEAVTFLVRVKEALEDPERMLLEV